MLRAFVALVVVVAVIALLRGLRSGMGERRPPELSGRTLRCAHCAVYFPREEAVVQNGRDYCSREHAEAQRRVQGQGEDERR